MPYLSFFINTIPTLPDWTPGRGEINHGIREKCLWYLLEICGGIYDIEHFRVFWRCVRFPQLVSGELDVFPDKAGAEKDVDDGADGQKGAERDA